MVVLYRFTQYFLMSQYQGFDIRKHHRRITVFKETGVYPRVAVLVPAAGEAVEILRDTLLAARKIRYPAYEVFLLDDSKDGMYKDVTAECKCRYVRRPNIGYHKKAGNMNYALRFLTGYKQALVLDADFRPRPEILNELVPYSGEDIGIVQSPQHFPMTKDVHKRSKIEYGAAYIQQDFYRITQVARDQFGAAICVGTNALYSIAAVIQVGGWEGIGMPHGWGQAEDVYTGAKMLNETAPSGKRYQLKYIPIQLAEGYCPDSHYSFYKQQNRWCTGSVLLLFSGKTLFSRKLSMAQRLIYGSTSLYYYNTIAILTAPLYLLVIILLNGNANWHYTYFFLPALALNFVVTPFLLRKKSQPLAVSLVVLSNAYTFLQAIYLFTRRHPMGWDPSGAKQVGGSSYFTKLKLTAYICFILFYILTFGAVILNDRIAFGPTMVIVGLFLGAFITHMVFMYYTLLGSITKRRFYLDRKFYASAFMTLAILAVGLASVIYRTTYNVAFGRDDMITIVRQPAARASYVSQSSSTTASGAIE
jgi:cellulose synthase (UDP-forming)